MRVRRWWQRIYRLRMAAGNERLDDSDDQHENEAADKQVGRRHKGQAGFAQTSKVKEGEQQQYGEAKKKRVRLQWWQRGGQRADPSRDANRYIQRVVDH